MLSLPVSDSSNSRASLQHYANNFVYSSSYFVTQTDLLQAIQKARGESDADWTYIKDKTIEKNIEQAKEGVKAGNFMAGFGLTLSAYIGEGRGGDYQSKALEDHEVLGLEEEQDFDGAVKRTLEALQSEKLQEDVKVTLEKALKGAPKGSTG